MRSTGSRRTRKHKTEKHDVKSNGKRKRDGGAVSFRTVSFLLCASRSKRLERDYIPSKDQSYLNDRPPRMKRKLDFKVQMERERERSTENLSEIRLRY